MLRGGSEECKTPRRDLDAATRVFFRVSAPQRSNYNGMKVKFIREIFGGDAPKNVTSLKSREFEEPLDEYIHRICTHFNFEQTPEMRTALISHTGKTLQNMAQNSKDPEKTRHRNVKARDKRNAEKEALRQVPFEINHSFL
jgi:hypothetical protein